MNLIALLESSPLHLQLGPALESPREEGLDNTPEIPSCHYTPINKITAIFRQKALLDANVYLKNKGSITRYKKLAQRDDLFSPRYDTLVYQFIKVTFSELRDKLRASDSVTDVEYQKRRNSTEVRLLVTFETRDLALEFTNRLEPTPFYSIPLLGYGESSRLTISFNYGNLSFFNFLDSSAPSYADFHGSLEVFAESLAGN